MATLFAFSSCQKENPDNTSKDGVRVITAEFENTASKTTLNSDGITPEWAAGDVLRILNATSYENITLLAGDIDENKITFTTTLEGTLYAVYPASATSMEKCDDGNITFTIPAIQDGTFASANICVATSTEDDDTNKDNLIFRNATAVLKITTPADVVGVDITAANSIAGTVTASFSGSEISLATSALDSKYVSAVGTSAPSENVFFLAVAPVTTGSTTVNCYETDKKGTEVKDSKELQKNVIYSMDLSSLTIDNSDLTGQRGILNGHEYAVVKCGEKNLKWATVNIGASVPQESGDFFSWGETEGYKPSGSKFSHSFGWNTYCGSSSFVEWNTLPYDNGTKILKPAYDAATANWESTWRTPTGGNSGEFKALFDATYWQWNETDKGYYVYVPSPSTDAGKVNGGVGSYDQDDALLFFLAAGNGYNNDLYNSEEIGNYWSSTLTSDSQKAHSLYINGYEYSVDAKSIGERYRGYCVRPVSE